MGDGSPFPTCNTVVPASCSTMPFTLPLMIIGASTAGATTAFFLVPVAATVALGAVGFSAVGPVAGSIAAGLQAGIGNVAVGSAFAAAQSVAMGGTLSGVVTAVGTTIGGVGAAAAAAAVL